MKRLYVGNISYRTKEETLRNTFGAFESITAVRIVTDKVSGKSRGFAFIDFSDDAEAAEAIADIDGYELEGMALLVTEARPKAKRVTEDKNRGARRFQRSREANKAGDKPASRGRGFRGKEVKENNKFSRYSRKK